MATLAAESQSIIVSAVAQDADLLTAAVVSAARVHHCEMRQVVLIIISKLYVII